MRQLENKKERENPIIGTALSGIRIPKSDEMHVFRNGQFLGIFMFSLNPFSFG